MKTVPSFLLAFCVLIVFLSGCSRSEQTYEHTFVAFNTMTTIKITASNRTRAMELFAGCEEIVRGYDNVFSPTKEGSALYKFNRNMADVFALDKRYASVFLDALYVHNLTDGMFDPSLRPLVDLWDITFADQGGEHRLPDRFEIETAKGLCGMDKFAYDTLSDGSVEIKKLAAEAALDFGGIAKGAALDAIIIYLRGNVRAALISVGGSSVGVIGNKSDGTSWKIGVQNPNLPTAYYATVDLSDGQTLSVSGSYQRYFQLDGAIYHHIIDPETGYPVSVAATEQSVFHSMAVYGNISGALSDALSTAFFVMGEEKADLTARVIGVELLYK